MNSKEKLKSVLVEAGESLESVLAEYDTHTNTDGRYDEKVQKIQDAFELLSQVADIEGISEVRNIMG